MLELYIPEMPRNDTSPLPPSGVTLGVSITKASHRRPAIGRLPTELWLITCDISVFSLSTTGASPEAILRWAYWRHPI